VMWNELCGRIVSNHVDTRVSDKKADELVLI
jgi:hypothetical protein